VEKFLSRKLLVTVLAVGLVAVSTLFDDALPAESLDALVTMLLTYVGGQSLVDSAAAIAAGKSLGEAAKGVKDAAEEADRVIS